VNARLTWGVPLREKKKEEEEHPPSCILYHVVDVMATYSAHTQHTHTHTHTHTLHDKTGERDGTHVDGQGLLADDGRAELRVFLQVRREEANTKIVFTFEWVPWYMQQRMSSGGAWCAAVVGSDALQWCAAVVCYSA
jgi:hypothetical protein